MKVLVMGATGGSGRAAMEALLAQGHEVTALARRPQALPPRPGLRVVFGDVLDAQQVGQAVRGQDAVVVTLGITEPALRVRLSGPRTTRMDVRSAGTRHALGAMQQHRVGRLVVLSAFGVGETRDRLPPLYKLFFAAVLKPQIDDTERQEEAVRASALAWTLVQPVNLTDEPRDTPPYVSPEGEVRGMRVARRQVGRMLAEALARPEWVRRTVAVSDA